MVHKLYAVVCKCWNAIYCTCKGAVNFTLTEHHENTIEYWKRIEHVDQQIKKRP